ncbi:immunoglobulin domain-containing protein [Actimicrobium sp. CCC2.4]|uniref:immunoglobulin domain-containing protein n=1 Tax=Actimicrobium sp. CCC2.4 TaxID=3048606 RepID=UPI002AC9E59C|nr:immunoglobulin domain-containing protein [Actimicrobium sp. CCC2.4]MEB0136269.1 immunoglobulin domain-containing protein [Actimicrobium sp. CCC2.4]WPX33613.1 immunoglobulin domain-containing protein [Actimicrobium sp. CCC2.4]
MKVSQNVKSWTIAAVSALLIAGCGGGGSSNDGATSPPAGDAPPAAAGASGRVTGTAVASDTGLPLGSVQVQLAGKTVLTAVDGSFSQDEVASAERLVVRLVRDGYADAYATTAVTAGATASVTARMTPISASATFDNSAGATVTDSTSPARVTLPPSSIVDAVTGAAPQGAVTVRLAAINPATNPANMPGDYTTSAGSTIESFGALSVQLRDAAGKSLNLAPGKTATIRIPLASRSGLPPPTIPLFYFNETTGLWVEEGVATLAGVAPNQYYEGSVKHFTVWNADKVADTIFVNGCVASADGKLLSGATVLSSGIDYSGSTTGNTDSQGKFRIAMRRNGLASIGATYPRSSLAVKAGPSSTDITLPACLELLSPGAIVPPSFLASPDSISAPNGTPVDFRAVMANGDTVTYQWSRNGRPITGATESRYRLPAVSPADDKAQFTVTATNKAGSVTSAPATLTVTPGVPPAELSKLVKLLLQSFDLGTMVSSPSSEFIDGDVVDKMRWLNPALACRTGSATGSFNGQAIPVGTELASGSNRISGTFNDCAVVSNSGVVLNGTANISYTLDAGLTRYSDIGEITNFRLRKDVGTPDATDLTGNGSVQFVSTRSRATGPTDFLATMTPVPGSTLRDNLTGQLTQFTGGDIVFSGFVNATGVVLEGSTEHRNVSFIFDGVPYVANGTLSFKSPVGGIPSGSGQLSLMRNGFQVGRIFVTPDGYFVEINGVVQRF